MMLHYTVFARPCKAIPPISRQDRALLFPVGWGKMRKTAKIRAPVPEREEGGINEGGDAGMEPVRVWTKQHAGVAEELARTGVYRAKGRYIALDLEEHAPLVLEVYDWLVAHTPAAPYRPEGAEYPVWVSFLREGTMLPGEGAVILELDPELITRINVAKWGAMLNYAYLPPGRGGRPATPEAAVRLRGQRRQGLHDLLLPSDQEGDFGQLAAPLPPPRRSGDGGPLRRGGRPGRPVVHPAGEGRGRPVISRTRPPLRAKNQAVN